MLQSVTRAFARAYHTRGIIGACIWTATMIVTIPARRRRLALQAKKDMEFDRNFNVDTGGIRSAAGFSIHSSDWVYGHAYQPVSVRGLRDMLALLDIEWKEYTFVDLGCGKGRALLIASEYPFKRCIGVEWASELVKVAKRNCKTFRNPTQRCTDLEVTCEDATTVKLPKGPLIVYLYNPFGDKLMTRCRDTIVRHSVEDGEPIIVAYVEPKCRKIWGQEAAFTTYFSNPDLCIYVNEAYLSKVSRSS